MFLKKIIICENSYVGDDIAWSLIRFLMCNQGENFVFQTVFIYIRFLDVF